MKELVNKYRNKLSLVLILLYLLIPLVVMFVKYNQFNFNSYYFWYDLTYIFGSISACVGLFNLIINLKKNIKDLTFKNLFPFILIIIIIFLSFIAAYTSVDKKLALQGEWYRRVGYYTYILFLGFYLNAINIEKKDYKIIGTFLCIVSTIMSIIALLNNDFTYTMFPKNKRPYNAIFANANHFGYYLSISVIVAIFLTLYEKNIFKKIIYYLMMSISFIMIIANDTFGSYLGVLIAIIFISIYSIVKKKNFQLIYIVLLFIILSLMIRTTNGGIVVNNFKKLFFDVEVVNNTKDEKLVDDIGSGRMKLWKYTIEIIKDNPVFGVGPNIVAKIYEKDGINQGVPHNFILEFAAYNGIPALIVYLTLLAYIFVLNFMNNDKYNIVLLACMLSYLISAFFGNMFFNTSPYFVIVMGLLSSDIILIKGNIVNKNI